MRSGADRNAATGTMRECFGVALRLGLTAFGGPVAHIGYFERCYVEQRQWLSRADFGGLVALCQMVPGPGSSQLGFLIGFRRAGCRGAVAAWAGFTLPSALLMALIAIGLGRYGGPAAIRGSVLHGFKLVAVAVVAQAVISMARTLCPDRPRALIALATLALVLLVAAPWASLAAVLTGAVAGAVVCTGAGQAAFSCVGATATVPRRIALGVLAVFALLMALALLAGGLRGHGIVALAALFYRSGALVFGGGHVVLPLLHDALVPGHWLDDPTFLAGYGVVQAMPGPLFTLAAYLGAACAPVAADWPIAACYALVALVAIMLPGLLIVTCALTLWQGFGHRARVQAALAGINAAVVGVLGAAWCNPVARAALVQPRDVVIALIGVFALLHWRVPPVVVVGLTLLASLVTS
jgi:chromate transporter